MSDKKPVDQRISAIPPFGLRMLPELRAQIENAAATSGRSMNAEIIHRLERTFNRSGPVPFGDLDFEKRTLLQSYEAVLQQQVSASRRMEIATQDLESVVRHLRSLGVEPGYEDPEGAN